MKTRSSMVHRTDGHRDQALPLELKVPNAETRAAMAEVDEMVSTRTARCLQHLDGREEQS